MEDGIIAKYCEAVSEADRDKQLLDMISGERNAVPLTKGGRVFS